MDVKLAPVQCKSEETSADVINVKEEEDILSEENDSKEETAKTPDPKLSGGLLRPSKKISKEKQVERHNADKFVKFFKKWRDLKRTNEDVRQQTKFWFSSFNKKLNKTYIYRDFFDSVRIHFRLAISGKNFNFDKFKDDDWHKLFANLTDFLRNEVYNSESKVDQEKKSQVVPVWIEGIDKFKIEGFPQYSH